MIYTILQAVPSIDSGNLKELAEGNPFLRSFTSWDRFVDYLPVLVTAAVVILFFFFFARFLESRLIKIIRRKTNSQKVLVANFFGKVLWLLVFAVGVMIAMGILGLGEISFSILGAAGLTTFVVGFALKDIFENFLAGVIIAFDPPFVLGSWIKVNDIEGVVQQMTLRETMLKTFDGQDVFIPNAVLLKNPLRNYNIDGFLRKEFVIGLDYGDDVQEGLKLIEKVMSNIDQVLTTEGRMPEARIDAFASSSVNIKCLFWVDTTKTSVPASKIQNTVMLKVLNALVEDGHYLPADILEIKYYDPASEKKDNGDRLRNQIEKM